MSASHSRARDLRRGDSLLSERVKQTGRAMLAPVVRLAVRLHLTANTVTVIGFGIVVVASVLVGTGNLLAGAALLTAGSLLDAVDGALARATGGTTAFGSFLDSTLDRAAEAILFGGVVAYFLQREGDASLPVLLAILALIGSFMVSYTRARAAHGAAGPGHRRHRAGGPRFRDRSHWSTCDRGHPGDDHHGAADLACPSAQRGHCAPGGGRHDKGEWRAWLTATARARPTASGPRTARSGWRSWAWATAPRAWCRVATTTRTPSRATSSRG